MGYYRAGGYGRAGGYYRAGGSIFGFLGKAVSTVAKGVASLGIPVVSGIAGAASSLLAPSRPSTIVAPTFGIPATLGVGVGTGQVPQRPEPGIAGAVHRMVPGGSSGYLPRRRMNAGNAKAARRAIRRITAVRNMLKSIEKQLPMRPAPRRYGSPGVITRSEAARALRR